jgi:hypothetical protein
LRHDAAIARRIEIEQQEAGWKAEVRRQNAEVKGALGKGAGTSLSAGRKAEVRRQKAEVISALGKGAGTSLGAMYHRRLACAEPVKAGPSRSNEAEENLHAFTSAFCLLTSAFDRRLACAEPVRAGPSRSNEAEENLHAFTSAFCLLTSAFHQNS